MFSMKLDDIPFPPSVNSIYAGKTRRYKSPDYEKWERQFDEWALSNWGQIAKVRNFCNAATENNLDFLTLRIDMFVHRSRIFSKNGTVKKIDCSNRVKPLLDALANVLYIDDNRYFLAGVEFCIYDSNKLPTVDVEFNQKRIRENVKPTR